MKKFENQKYLIITLAVVLVIFIIQVVNYFEFNIYGGLLCLTN